MDQNKSMPDVLRIQRPRLIHVVSALDDGAAVGEDSEIETVHLELEQKAIETDLADGFQVAGHGLEVKGRGAAVGDLHGIAAAQAGGVRALIAVKPFKAAALAAGTIDLAQERSDLDAALDIVPDIEIDELAVDLVEPAGQNLERLSGLDARHDGPDRRQD